MKLIYKHNQEKHFKIITYPDGQQNVELDLEYFNNPKDQVFIYCSIRNFRELEILIALCAALRKNDFFISHIKFNYLFGMRCDRSFALGQPNYFRDVVAPIINSLEIPEVHVLQPHSYRVIQHLNNAHAHSKFPNLDGCWPIGGDQSFQRYYGSWGFNFHFIKERTENGVKIALENEFFNKIGKKAEYAPIIILDDLCDGGATFIEISKYIKEYFPDNKQLFLYVTHGLFTKGVDHVAEHYDKIITTNSYQEFGEHPKLEVIDVWNT